MSREMTLDASGTSPRRQPGVEDLSQMPAFGRSQATPPAQQSPQAAHAAHHRLAP